MSSSLADLLIGAVNLEPGPFTGDNFFGLIDEVRIYSRALSETEIHTLYVC